MDMDKVAIGIYRNRVLAWRVDTNNPLGLEVVYREQGRPRLFSLQAELEEQGFHPVIVFWEEQEGGTEILLLA